MEVDDAIQEMLARAALAVTTYLCADENFDRSTSVYLLSNVRDDGGVVKGQQHWLVRFFFMLVLGGLAFSAVSIIIRPVRRQNVVPTHWVRK